MTLCVVYHSETGTTRTVAEAIAAGCGGTPVAVRDRADYSRAAMYLTGAPKARRGEKAEIEPARIDVSAFDLIVVGSPVWAFRPTPAANAAIAGLEGCEGKKGYVIATHAGMPGKTLALMKDALERRGVRVVGSCALGRHEVTDGNRLRKLVEEIRAAAGE
jgi:flavorubredoxin